MAYCFVSFQCSLSYHAPASCDIMRNWFNKCRDVSIASSSNSLERSRRFRRTRKQRITSQPIPKIVRSVKCASKRMEVGIDPRLWRVSTASLYSRLQSHGEELSSDAIDLSYPSFSSPVSRAPIISVGCALVVSEWSLPHFPPPWPSLSLTRLEDARE